MNTNDNKQSGASPLPGRRRWLGIGLLAGLGSLIGMGLIAGNAYSHGWGHRGGGHTISEEHVIERLEHVMDRIDATPEQRSRIESIVRAAWADLQGSADRHRGNRDAMLKVLQADSVDRGQLRALREDEMDLISNVSSRVLEALGDAAEVLDASQRQVLIERWSRFRH